jgi:hypothetical protein
MVRARRGRRLGPAVRHEALARAYEVAGDTEAADRHLALARELGEQVADPEDKELLDKDLATIRA